MKTQFNLRGIAIFIIILIAFFVGLWLGAVGIETAGEYSKGYTECMENENLIIDQRVPVFGNVSDKETGKIYLASLYIEEELE